jgi:hypothetical protein
VSKPELKDGYNAQALADLRSCERQLEGLAEKLERT